MKTITEIKDKENIKKEYFPKVRTAARGIFLTKENLIPIIYVSKHNYYKLPGGGLEKEEDEKEALKREVKEETGSDVEVKKEVGKIIEYRAKWGMKQTSYCFWGKVTSKGEPSFTEEEIEDGFEVCWFSIKEAVEIFENVSTNDYHGKFVTKRDLCFLREAEKMT